MGIERYSDIKNGYWVMEYVCPICERTMELALCGTAIAKLYCGQHMETQMITTGEWKKYRNGKVVIKRERDTTIDPYFSGLEDDKVVS